MSSLREFFERMNMPIKDNEPILTEDIPNYIMIAMMPSPLQITTLVGMLIRFGLRIEELEEEVFHLKFDIKDGENEK